MHLLREASHSEFSQAVWRIIKGMSILYFLADAFINTFGITQPTAKTRRQVAFFICGLILLVLAGVSGAGLLIHSFMR